jgi:hypothetical protein
MPFFEGLVGRKCQSQNSATQHKPNHRDRGGEAAHALGLLREKE